MSIQSLEITGLRAFGIPRKINFAIPNGKLGSGLTLFVGPNNGGKSTIIEALRALAGRRPQSFSVGKRNPVANDRIAITAIDTNGGLHELKTLGVGGSEASYSGTEAIGRIFVLPSRRFFSPMFGKSSTTRDAYITNYGLPAIRGTKVTAILDGNKKEVAETFKREFPKFGCFLIDADDVRTKPPRKETIEVHGLLDEHGKLRPENVKCVTEIVAETNRELDTTAK
jgi:hypothetical protein